MTQPHGFPDFLGHYLLVRSRHTNDDPDTYREAFHAHQGLELLYVHEGSGQVIVNQTMLQVEKGSLLVFQPFQLHRVSMDVRKTPYTRSYLIINPVILEPYLAVFPQLESFFRRLSHGDGEFLLLTGLEERDLPIMLLLDLIDKGNSSAAGPLSMEPLARTFLFLLHALQERVGRSFPRPYASRVDHRIEQIMQWIERHYMEAFALDRMADSLHLSPYYLSHAFRNGTGSTILDYLHAHRVKQACLLLVQTEYPVSLIAEKTGYSDASYFCRIFKKKVGLTPHQYRKKCR